ncbi:hypothetical protein BSPWISOX_714 [uncultured Gammaproteobacteria bacterium]|nr:hypothetical protein BSPWISOX_714 [uncultured Gammaproteobacteria bacterium]
MSTGKFWVVSDLIFGFFLGCIHNTLTKKFLSVIVKFLIIIRDLCINRDD